MNEFMEGNGLLILWLGFLLLMILGIAAIFLWGVRTRQFSDQDRARYLPLDNGRADNYPGEEGQRRKADDA